MKELVVSKKAAKLLAEGFLWVYRSEIVDKKRFLPGEVVRIVDEQGSFLALGYVNLQSTIAVRVMSFKAVEIDRTFFQKRIEEALRQRAYIPSNAYRVVHSEADLLPGLIVDRYDTILSIHLQTYAMVQYKALVCDVLQELLTPEGMVVTADAAIAKKEGFAPFYEIVGAVRKCVIEENGVRFAVDVLHDQKTGFYLDQRRNRSIVATYMPSGGRVLDCFSNSGGFGLYCAIKKGADATLVDISAEAIARARENFELNGVQASFIEANVFDYLRAIRGRERYDMVVLDPPSFAKSRRQREGALRGFKDIAVNGMKVVKEGGYLALFSCSHHIGREDLEAILRKAAKDNHKRLIVKEYLLQDHDHPILLSMPPTHYLNGILVQLFDV